MLAHVYTHACAHVKVCLDLFVTNMDRVGKNCIHTQHMTVYLVISLPKIPFMHRIYMVLASPVHEEIVRWEPPLSNAKDSCFSVTDHVASTLHPA